ncbi:MAG: VWA domain-containing protein [Bacilli bacterium]|nr:VWA domain-containing protein [Bacilli bacterium]
MTKSKKSGSFSFIKIIVVLWVISFLFSNFSSYLENHFSSNNNNKKHSSDTLYIISSSENKPLDSYIKKFAKKEKIKIEIEYADTLDIIAKLNSGEEYDAVWSANSIWNYKLNKSVSLSESKSMSINPVIFGVKKSKAQELGFVGKDIKTKDILDAIKAGKLKFSMSNPNSTNSGAVAYLGIISTLAGNPDVLTEEIINKDSLKEEIKAFFSGMERTSGDEDYLEELFLNGDYDAVISYESSIININKELEKKKKETLYALYPTDGVSISDSIFALVNNKDEDKKEDFLKIQDYFLSGDGQEVLASLGRRTWYGGTTDTADKKVFNPKWGIDTTKLISPLKYPSDAVINKALNLYQEELRKPIHVVFCLDYSGSMSGSGYRDLVEAMEYILDYDRASVDNIQFNYKDKINIIPFESYADTTWSAYQGDKTEELLYKIKNKYPSGATALYSAAINALDILAKDTDTSYNKSIILMTDGDPNEYSSFSDLEKKYKKLENKIPIYSITFGSAKERYLEQIAKLTNAKVFDGKTSLIEAFKEVREYN